MDLSYIVDGLRPQNKPKPSVNESNVNLGSSEEAKAKVVSKASTGIMQPQTIKEGLPHTTMILIPPSAPYLINIREDNFFPNRTYFCTQSENELKLTPYPSLFQQSSMPNIGANINSGLNYVQYLPMSRSAAPCVPMNTPLVTANLAHTTPSSPQPLHFTNQPSPHLSVTTAATLGRMGSTSGSSSASAAPHRQTELQMRRSNDELLNRENKHSIQGSQVNRSLEAKHSSFCSGIHKKRECGTLSQIGETHTNKTIPIQNLNEHILVLDASNSQKNEISTKTRQYVCQDCGRSFFRKSDLVRHIQIHLGIKPNICNVCGKKFIQRSALTVHQRVHTGEKPYSCPVCRRAFSDSSSLARHRRIHLRETENKSPKRRGYTPRTLKGAVTKAAAT